MQIRKSLEKRQGIHERAIQSKVLLFGPRRKFYPVYCSHSKSLSTTPLDSFSTIHVITKVIAFLSQYINWTAECTEPTSESAQNKTWRRKIERDS